MNSKETKKIVGQIIRDYRDQFDCDQTMLSFAMGISQPKLSKIEAGILEISLSEAMYLSFIFGINWKKEFRVRKIWKGK